MVAQAIGYDIGSDYLEYALEYLSGGGDHKPSMLVDIEQKRLTENEYHAGKMFRYAEQYGVDVPVIQTVYYLLKNLERGVILGAYVSEGMKPKAAKKVKMKFFGSGVFSLVSRIRSLFGR